MVSVPNVLQPNLIVVICVLLLLTLMIFKKKMAEIVYWQILKLKNVKFIVAYVSSYAFLL